MSSPSVAGYRAGTGQIFIREGADGEKFILVYNDTAATLANGTVKIIDWTDDADSKGYYPTPGVAADTSTVRCRIVGVINDCEGTTSGIADTEFGWMQIEGYCPAITTGATVTDEAYLELIASAPTVATEDASLGVGSFGIAKSGCTGAGTIAGVLFGYPVAIAAT